MPNDQVVKFNCWDNVCFILYETVNVVYVVQMLSSGMSERDDDKEEIREAGLRAGYEAEHMFELPLRRTNTHPKASVLKGGCSRLSLACRRVHPLPSDWSRRCLLMSLFFWKLKESRRVL